MAFPPVATAMLASYAHHNLPSLGLPNSASVEIGHTTNYGRQRCSAAYKSDIRQKPLIRSIASRWRKSFIAPEITLKQNLLDEPNI
jgi:hypothetical protein